MSNKQSNQSSHTLSDEALDDLLGSTGFVEVPPLFTNKVMQEIDALPTSDHQESATSKGVNASLDTQSPTEWWQWVALIGGGIPAFLQILMFIFSAWNVASLG